MKNETTSVSHLFEHWKTSKHREVASNDQWRQWLTDIQVLDSGTIPLRTQIELRYRYPQQFARGCTLENLSNVIKTEINRSCFYELLIADRSIEVGIATPESIENYQKRILSLQPEPENIDLYMFWVQLSQENHHININAITERWEAAISQLTGLQYAQEITLFINTIISSDKTAPKDAAETSLSHALSQVTLVPEKFIPQLLPVNNNELADSRVKTIFPDTVLEEVDDTYFDRLIDICNWSQEIGLGHVTKNIHEYLITVAESIDLSTVEATSAFRLIQYFIRSSEASPERLQRFCTQVAELELISGSKRPKIAGIFVQLLLKNHQFDRACKVAQQLESVSFYHPFVHLIKYAAAHGQLNRARDLEAGWLKKQFNSHTSLDVITYLLNHNSLLSNLLPSMEGLVGGNTLESFASLLVQALAQVKPEKLQQFEDQWNRDQEGRQETMGDDLKQQWFHAASDLLEEGIDITHEPEVLEYFSHTHYMSLRNLIQVIEKVIDISGDPTSLLRLLRGKQEELLRDLPSHWYNPENAWEKLLEAHINFALLHKRMQNHQETVS